MGRNTLPGVEVYIIRPQGRGKLRTRHGKITWTSLVFFIMSANIIKQNEKFKY